MCPLVIDASSACSTARHSLPNPSLFAALWAASTPGGGRAGVGGHSFLDGARPALLGVPALASHVPCGPHTLCQAWEGVRWQNQGGGRGSQRIERWCTPVPLALLAPLLTAAPAAAVPAHPVQRKATVPLTPMPHTSPTWPVQPTAGKLTRALPWPRLGCPLSSTTSTTRQAPACLRWALAAAGQPCSRCRRQRPAPGGAAGAAGAPCRCQCQRLSSTWACSIATTGTQQQQQQQREASQGTLESCAPQAAWTARLALTWRTQAPPTWLHHQRLPLRQRRWRRQGSSSSRRCPSCRWQRQAGACHCRSLAPVAAALAAARTRRAKGKAVQWQRPAPYMRQRGSRPSNSRRSRHLARWRRQGRASRRQQLLLLLPLQCLQAGGGPRHR